MGTAADTLTLQWVAADEPRSRAAKAISLVGRGDPLPAWVGPVVSRIEELADLDTVDPLVERPLNIEDVLDALSFMERVMCEDTCLPWIGRLSSGGVELTWKHGDLEVEAVFDRRREDRELLVSVGEHDWDAPADQGDSLFASVVDRLSNSYIEHASGAPAAVARA